MSDLTPLLSVRRTSSVSRRCVFQFTLLRIIFPAPHIQPELLHSRQVSDLSTCDRLSASQSKHEAPPVVPKQAHISIVVRIRIFAVEGDGRHLPQNAAYGRS